ncbi:MAG: YceD family protein [Gammaproteobacteria bacterium]
MPRLAAAVADIRSLANAELQAMHDGGQLTVHGEVEANLLLTCQRCFGSMHFPVKAEFNLAWVRNENEALRLPDMYEPLLSASGRVKLAELIEDELLLALPMVALHALPQECSTGVHAASRQTVADAKAARRAPFAALKALKRR